MSRKQPTQSDNLPHDDKFLGAMKQILTVSKEELKKREDEWKKKRMKTGHWRRRG